MPTVYPTESGSESESPTCSPSSMPTVYPTESVSESESVSPTCSPSSMRPSKFAGSLLSFYPVKLNKQSFSPYVVGPANTFDSEDTISPTNKFSIYIVTHVSLIQIHQV
jgi:hypothetical protein